MPQRNVLNERGLKKSLQQCKEKKTSTWKIFGFFSTEMENIE